MMRKLALLLLLSMLAACNKPEQPSPYHALDVSWRYEQAAPDFQLTDHTGKVRRLADFRGKVVVLFFGYTHCPDVCPTTLADWAQVLRRLGTDADKVQVLFVTVDPQRDTRDVLARFVPSFDPSFLGLYGDAAATAQAAKIFTVNYEKHAAPGAGYTMDHSDGVFLIGRGGRPVLMSPYAQPTDVLVQDVRLLLQAVD